MDADTGQIVAAALTTKDVDDGSQVGSLLDQVTTSVASSTADGAYDQEGVAAAVAERHPEALIIVPLRSTAVSSETAESAPTQRDCHLQCITDARTSGLAEGIWLHHPSPGRCHHRQVQAGDR